MVFRNSTNATQQDLYEAKKIFDKVKSGISIENLNIQSNTEIKPKNSSYNSCYALLKTETLVNEFPCSVKKYFQRSINDDLEKISLELMFKANRRLVRYLANKEEILHAKKRANFCKTNGKVSIAHLSLFGLRIAGTAAGYEAYTTLTFESALGGPIGCVLAMMR